MPQMPHRYQPKQNLPRPPSRRGTLTSRHPSHRYQPKQPLPRPPSRRGTVTPRHPSQSLCTAPVSPVISLPHVRLYEVVSLHMGVLPYVYEVVSLHMGVLPYKYRKILEKLLKLMKLCCKWGAGARHSLWSPHVRPRLYHRYFAV